MPEIGRNECKPAVGGAAGGLERDGMRLRPSLFVGFLVSILLVVFAQESDLSFQAAALVAVPVLAFELHLLCRSSRSALCMPSGLFWLALVLFHFGLVIPAAIGVDLPIEFVRQTGVDRWFPGEFGSRAVSLCLLGSSALLVGRSCAHRSQTARPDSRHPPAAHAIAQREAQLIGVVGVACLATGTLSWFGGAISRGGLSIFLGSYGDYLIATESAGFAFEYLSIAVGLVFVAASGRTFPIVVGLPFFAAFSAVALPLGLRGEVLFPVAAFAWIGAKRLTPLANRSVLILVAVFLVVSATIREVRSVGLGNVGLQQVAAGSLLTGMAEMGGTIRPVVECLRWRALGDEFLLGTSYWAPVERIVTRVLPITERPPGDQDMRLQNNVVRERVGNIGFSVIAEAYMNFGPPGVAAVLCLVGFLLGLIDVARPDARHLALGGIVFVPLLAHVRNDFTPLPAHLLVGFICVGSTSMLARVRTWK